MAITQNIYTPYCQRFIRDNANTPYGNCLYILLNKVIEKFTNNIQCVILLGGLVREGRPILGWSDIDVIIIYRDILKRNPQDITKITKELEKQYDIRIDLTQIDLCEIRNIHTCFNSGLLNALAMRPNVSELLYGTMPKLKINQKQELQAASYYIDNTVHLLREYLIEYVYNDDSAEHFDEYISRITRWVFSIIRASLRLFDIYVHPYKPSLNQLETLVPDMDLSVPYKLLAFRNDKKQLSPDFKIFIEIEKFTYNYVRTILNRKDLHYEEY
jgi:predicted nucleotidyltransferase